MTGMEVASVKRLGRRVGVTVTSVRDRIARREHCITVKGASSPARTWDYGAAKFMIVRAVIESGRVGWK